MKLAEVAVPAPLAGTLTYRLPPALEGRVVPGSRVVVELGRRRVLSLVVDVLVGDSPEGVALKDVVSVVDAEPVLPAELLRFLVELSAYYFAPPGEVMRLALPAVSRDDAERVSEGDEVKKSRQKVVGGRKLQIAKATSSVEEPGKLRGNGLLLLRHLRATGESPVSKLAETWKNARDVVHRLAQQGLVEVIEREAPRDPFFSEQVPRDEAPEPTAAQAEAMAEIDRAIGKGQPASYLLHGVTGSGKTEVYLHAIATSLSQGKGALVLVPEIALTPQLVGRFRARFGDGVSVLHSGLSPRDRHAMWQSLRRGEVKVAIGARSALFAPVPSLGLVIVDEEHDPSFKQEEGVRYHARDMAMLRAHRAGSVCVLGSATPSLETEQLCRVGRVTKLRLPGRARASSTLPEVQVVDLRRTGPGPSGDRRISKPLHDALVSVLERGEQAILFLNRRGFAPSVVCEACGTIESCPLCSVALTFHRGPQLMRCHYCDYQRRFDGKCAACRSDKVTLEGLGTERLEEAVAAAFTGARVARLDRDVASGQKAEQILERVRAHEVDILIGTQMVAKGHDIPKVTLVGVINADAALSMPDMRATERAFHLLVQVAGRAGRGEARGLVVLQTRDPENLAITAAAAHDVDGFTERELAARAELCYPPFSRLAMVRLDGPDEDVVRRASMTLGKAARDASPSQRHDVDVLGPAPSPIARLRGRYRFQLLLKARERKPLRHVVAVLLDAQKQVPRGVRVSLDIDPVSML